VLVFALLSFGFKHGFLFVQAAHAKEAYKLQQLLGLQQQLQRLSLSASRQATVGNCKTPSIAWLSKALDHLKQQLNVESHSDVVGKLLKTQQTNFELFQRVNDLDERIGQRKDQVSKLRKERQREKKVCSIRSSEAL
jgi:predicted CopG family antitoxin